MKRLYLSNIDKKLSGLCGGIAEYLNIDSTVIRVIYIILTFMTGFIPAIIAYLVCMFIIPRSPEV